MGQCVGLAQHNRWGYSAYLQPIGLTEIPSSSARSAVLPAAIKHASTFSQSVSRNGPSIERYQASNRSSCRFLRSQAASDSTLPSTSAQSTTEPSVAAAGRLQSTADSSTALTSSQGGAQDANFLASSSGSSLAESSTDDERDSIPQPPKTAAQKAKELTLRVLSGLVLGLSAAGIILYGREPALLASIAWTYGATQEYYGFITSKGISKGMTPPPRTISVVTTALCMSMPLMAYFVPGRSGTVLAVAGFVLLVMQVLAIKKPKFSQLASSLFGLFYCGWLPSFWIKLRLIDTPVPPAAFVAALPSCFDWTVGLLATFTAAACIIAADTGAFFVGRHMGRTKLTDISPKKTWEGAAGGMVASTAVALAGWKFLAWPATPLAAIGFGVGLFFSSLFGDLIESIMKRDAGLKDSGNLIPGHGGLLDRMDSYMFSGAVAFAWVRYCIPFLCGTL